MLFIGSGYESFDPRIWLQLIELRRATIAADHDYDIGTRPMVYDNEIEIEIER